MSTREQKNEERLQLIDPSIRDAIANVLRGMEADGHSPVIAADVWRSPERQIELYKLGRTQLKWGFHNAVLPDGSPGSLAADIVCFKYGWDVLTSWWLHLGFHAWQMGLDWGGYFGLDGTARERLRDCVEHQAFDLIGKLAIGWDPAHVETSFVTVGEARSGKR